MFLGVAMWRSLPAWVASTRTSRSTVSRCVWRAARAAVTSWNGGGSSLESRSWQQSHSKIDFNKFPRKIIMNTFSSSSLWQVCFSQLWGWFWWWTLKVFESPLSIATKPASLGAVVAKLWMPNRWWLLLVQPVLLQCAHFSLDLWACLPSTLTTCTIFNMQHLCVCFLLYFVCVQTSLYFLSAHFFVTFLRCACLLLYFIQVHTFSITLLAPCPQLPPTLGHVYTGPTRDLHAFSTMVLDVPKGLRWFIVFFLCAPYFNCTLLMGPRLLSLYFSCVPTTFIALFLCGHHFFNCTFPMWSLLLLLYISYAPTTTSIVLFLGAHQCCLYFYVCPLLLLHFSYVVTTTFIVLFHSGHYNFYWTFLMCSLLLLWYFSQVVTNTFIILFLGAHYFYCTFPMWPPPLPWYYVAYVVTTFLYFMHVHAVQASSTLHACLQFSVRTHHLRIVIHGNDALALWPIQCVFSVSTRARLHHDPEGAHVPSVITALLPLLLFTRCHYPPSPPPRSLAPSLHHWSSSSSSSSASASSSVAFEPWECQDLWRQLLLLLHLTITIPPLSLASQKRNYREVNDSFWEVWGKRKKWAQRLFISDKWMCV